jgi:hypothetical protein
VSDSTPAVSRPARGLAMLGDIATSGVVIACEQIAPIIVHAYRVYEYAGVSDGMAIYHEIGELKELEAEQADRQITGGDR